jgi:hypothetical protein
MLQFTENSSKRREIYVVALKLSKTLLRGAIKNTTTQVDRLWSLLKNAQFCQWPLQPRVLAPQRPGTTTPGTRTERSSSRRISCLAPSVQAVRRRPLGCAHGLFALENNPSEPQGGVHLRLQSRPARLRLKSLQVRFDERRLSPRELCEAVAPDERLHSLFDVDLGAWGSRRRVRGTWRRGYPRARTPRGSSSQVGARGIAELGYSLAGGRNGRRSQRAELAPLAGTGFRPRPTARFTRWRPTVQHHLHELLRIRRGQRRPPRARLPPAPKAGQRSW